MLNRAPLKLAGRSAMHGVPLFDDDPPARVRWVATTRKICADERARLERGHREFLRRCPQWSMSSGAHGVLSPELADRLRRAVGFGDVLVHEYVQVDDEIVQARVKDPGDLADLVAAGPSPRGPASRVARGLPPGAAW